MDPFSLDHIILSVPSLFNVKKTLGLTRLELVTSCLSGTRSNHLSYSPIMSITDIWEKRRNCLEVFRELMLGLSPNGQRPIK